MAQSDIRSVGERVHEAGREFLELGDITSCLFLEVGVSQYEGNRRQDSDTHRPECQRQPEHWARLSRREPRGHQIIVQVEHAAQRSQKERNDGERRKPGQPVRESGDESSCGRVRDAPESGSVFAVAAENHQAKVRERGPMIDAERQRFVGSAGADERQDPLDERASVDPRPEYDVREALEHHCDSGHADEQQGQHERAAVPIPIQDRCHPWQPAQKLCLVGGAAGSVTGMFVR